MDGVNLGISLGAPASRLKNLLSLESDPSWKNRPLPIAFCGVPVWPLVPLKSAVFPSLSVPIPGSGLNCPGDSNDSLSMVVSSLIFKTGCWGFCAGFKLGSGEKVAGLCGVVSAKVCWAVSRSGRFSPLAKSHSGVRSCGGS